MTTDIDGKADIYLTDGHVHILGMNPTTGETKETDVDPGTKVTVYLYNDRAVDSVMFEPEEFTVDELPFEVLKKISKDKKLKKRIAEAMGEESVDRIEFLSAGEEAEDGLSSLAFADEEDDTPLPSESEVIPSSVVSATNTPAPTVKVSATNTPTPTVTVSATNTPTPTVKVSTTNTPAPTVKVSATNTPTPTVTVSATNTPAPTVKVSATNTPTPTVTVSATNTPAPTVKVSATNTPTPTVTVSATNTPAPTKTASVTPAPASTETPASTNTAEPAITPAPTASPTGTPMETPTSEPTATPTQTPAVTPAKTYSVSVNTASVSGLTNAGVVGSISDYEEGDTVHLFAELETGYSFLKWTVTDADGNIIEVADSTSENASFIMPAGNVNISAATVKNAYEITVIQPENGEISVRTSGDSNSAFYGDIVTLNAAAVSGYELSEWSVTTASGKEVTVINNATFTMPAENVTVRAVFVSDNMYNVANATDIPGDSYIEINGARNANVSVKAGSIVTLDIHIDDNYYFEPSRLRIYNENATDMSNMYTYLDNEWPDNVETLSDISNQFTMPENNVNIVMSLSEKSESGIFGVFSEDGKTFEIYNHRPEAGSGTIYEAAESGRPSWAGQLTEVETVRFMEPVYPQSTAEWFAVCFKLKEIENISYLNTSNVTDMGNMFNGCTSLTALDLSSFNTSNVTNMMYMFDGCSSLTTLDLNNFDTSNVTNMSHMFYDCSAITTLDLSTFDTSNVTDMSNMFVECSSLTTLDLSSFNTLNVTEMMYMFGSCFNITTLDLSCFDTSNVTDMMYMFAGCSSLTTLDFSSFDTSNVTDMGYMFYECSSLTTLDLSRFDTSNVTDMSSMFSFCTFLTALNLSNFDTSNVTDMSDMFFGCSSLTVLDLSNFNTSNVTNMCNMFNGCDSLTTLDLSRFDTSNVTDMSSMFYFCTFKALDLSNFNTENVINMGDMFKYCYLLKNLYIDNFSVTNAINLKEMFSGSSSLEKIYISDYSDWSNTSAVSDNMFKNCTKLSGQNGTSYLNNQDITDATYARIDTAVYDSEGNLTSGSPGYFSVR
ncbi:MAG: BspA family leucine-rich repeat surface protein [Lachnospiraceae bacterium]|nr:BspA family leucine-rich repeat surface protein [Lachnospiraceae bacterium]